MSKNYEFLTHTADIKFCAWGDTLEEAFGAAACALLESMTKEHIKPKVKKSVGVDGDDLESLLYNFLEEIIYLVDAENLIIGGVENMEISKEDVGGYILKCDLLGDDAQNYDIGEHIKAVTYNDMEIKEGERGWEITVVLDV